MTTLHERLKTITKPLHDEIEQNRLSKILLSDAPNLDAYKEFLLKMLMFIKPIEEAMLSAKEWSECGLDQICRIKSKDIESDLEILGVKAMIESEVILPRFDDFFSILGAWYVLEGSMVGASMQAPILRKGLCIDEQSGLLYMSGYGSRTFEVWKRFTDKLNEIAPDAKSQKKVILTACDTFLSLKLWLDEPIM